LTQISLY